MPRLLCKEIERLWLATAKHVNWLWSELKRNPETIPLTEVMLSDTM